MTRYTFVLAGLLAAPLTALPCAAQTLPSTLYGSGTDARDWFGESLALHGTDRLAVGAPRDINTNEERYVGRVYLFDRAPGGPWVETGFLMPAPDGVPTDGGGNPGGAYGAAMAFSPDGQMLVVGAYGESHNPLGPVSGPDNGGSGYVYRATGIGGWALEAKLIEACLRDYAQTGKLVAAAGSLVAMNGDIYGRGLSVFRHAPGTDDGGDGPGGSAFGPWREEVTLTTGNVAGFLTLRGEPRLAVVDHPTEGERVVGGAGQENPGNGGRGGAAYVWRNDGPEGGPAAWTLEARLTAPGDPLEAYFGQAVALSPDGRLLLVGAAGLATAGVHVFRREGSGAASTWVREARLGDRVPSGNTVGAGAAALSFDPVSGDPLVLVTTTGYEPQLYRRAAGVWSRIWADPTFGADGNAAVLSGTTVAVGRYYDGTLGVEAGQALVFDLSRAVPAEPASPGTPALAVSVAPNPARGRASVALSGPPGAAVRVTVVDALGRTVRQVHDGPLGTGAQRLAVDVSGLPAGAYVVRVVPADGADRQAVTARLAVVR